MRAANMRALSNELEAAYPGVVIGGVGDPPHQREISDHNEDDTPGSKPAQSDPDFNPEHRAIDVMLGPAMTVAQMQAIIDFILARPRLLRRLKYINFLNWQWSASTGWARHDNSHDPHPDHGHFSGLASNDEDASPWLTETGVSNVSKIVHQEGRGWWEVGNGAPKGIATEDQLKDLERAYGPTVIILDERNYGIGLPPEPGPPVVLTPAQLEAVIDGITARLDALRTGVRTDTRDAVADGLEGGVTALRS